MACNSCNNLRSEVAGILFPDFVSHSCCNPCCSNNAVGGIGSNGCGCGCGCGNVGGTSCGCGCGNVGGTSCNSCGCGNVGGTSCGCCSGVGGTNSNVCCLHRSGCCYDD